MTEQEQSYALQRMASSNTATALAERERANIESAMTIAKRFPRDEQMAAANLMRSADRVGFAERACYAFPRGGSTVSGPSVTLAREFMRAWGNVESGFIVVDSNDEKTIIEAWALDLETNTRKRQTACFRSKIQRKNYRTKETEWVVPDERDMVELINRQAAKAERNAILALLPRDVVDECLARCKQTLINAADGNVKDDPERVVRNLLAAFKLVGVSREQLEAKVETTLESMSGENCETLRDLYRGISTGETNAADTFPQINKKADTASSKIGAALKETQKD